MPAPVAVSRWLASTYPTTQLDPQWLDDACTYLQTTFPALTPPQLIKRVEEQLMLADLADAVAQGALPIELAMDAAEPPKSTRIGVGPRAAILVQIMAISDIGHSALSQRDVHEERKEERRIAGEGGDVAGARVAGNDEGTEDDGRGERKFPRAMLMLELSDGHTLVRAIEYKPIAGLSLEDTPLGAKVCQNPSGVL